MGKFSKPKLVIWGASGHALVVADIIQLEDKYETIGFLDDVNPPAPDNKLAGLPVFHDRETLDELHQKGIRHLLIGMGDCDARLRLSQYALSKGFQLATAIHPKSIIADGVQIKAGTVVTAGVVINPGAMVGGNVILNTLSGIDHQCLIEDGVHVGPGAHIGGNVFIGRGAWVGIGAVIKDKVHIGAESIIGAGAVVLNDIPNRVVAYGVPARVIRDIG